MTVRPHRVTRRLVMSKQALRLGVIDLDDLPGVSYFVNPNHRNPARWGRYGEFPHAATVRLEDQCRAMLLITAMGTDDAHLYDPDCTREHGHDGPHVSHIAPGFPIAAWIDDPLEDLA